MVAQRARTRLAPSTPQKSPTHEPGSLEKGMGYTVPILAERIKELANRWQMRPEGVADDAIFARMGSGAGSISDEFARAGVNFVRVRKADRISGWEQMRRLLQDAGKPDRPGLYVRRPQRLAGPTSKRKAPRCQHGREGRRGSLRGHSASRPRSDGRL